ncbi:membrane protein DedA, SNARE-associated domain [Nonomuraea solani]|uniref:Membrane protein DedA, SNARE-associated domain n=1 Tax=Nonomuraea solani TaxID=1144553 RepID=A0A1H6EQX9_9ACTN|nr:DedA family protein [Nonomuraea solani]SEH00258.1 membrane protein DedA, SNARE-associated domain [Nonomuraea solani]
MELSIAQPISEPTGGLAGWAIDLIDSLGEPGLALLCALDSMLSIVPADIVMPLVGFSAAQGAISLGAAIAWATAGSVAGSLVLYALGARLGRDRARALLTKIPGIKTETVDRTEAWFARHGAKAVVFGRLLPGFRSLISVPAGVERMPLPTFVLLTAIGSLMWNSILLVTGYLLGENWHRMADVTGMFQYVFFGALAVAAVFFVAKRRGRRRKQQAKTVVPDGVVPDGDATE